MCSASCENIQVRRRCRLRLLLEWRVVLGLRRRSWIGWSGCRLCRRRRRLREGRDCVGTTRLGKPSCRPKGASERSASMGDGTIMNSNTLTSPMISEVCGFQHNARLSLPQDSRRSASCVHHESESTPFSWPVRIWNQSKI